LLHLLVDEDDGGGEMMENPLLGQRHLIRISWINPNESSHFVKDVSPYDYLSPYLWIKLDELSRLKRLLPNRGR
jgi:hypothetical protein